MSRFAHFFTAVRDTETGELELDCLTVIDLNEVLNARALRALCDSVKEFDENHPDLRKAEERRLTALNGMSMRARVQQNTLFNRVLRFDDDAAWTRDEVSSLIESLTVARLKELVI